MSLEFVSVKLPKNTVEKVRRIVEMNRDLFENESEYITHCIINYNRTLKF
ncbi:MAG: hypothetical protein QXE31_01995 [Candidatus Woesearchaeota archaeon]